MKVIAAVSRARSPWNSSAKRPAPRPPAVRVFQISGSSTYACIHTVSNAGSTPTKNTPRHPHRGITSRLTSAAAP